MPSESGPQGQSSTAQADAPRGPGRCNELVLSFLVFVSIAIGVWLVLGGKRYRAEYADSTLGWRVGTTRAVELTLAWDDKTNLGCASEHAIAGLRCGYGRDGQRMDALSADSPEVLQPYNTVGGELLLGAGLWTAPDLKQPLPQSRFSVVCNYVIKGVVKSARIRFDATSSFSHLGKTVTVGTLTDCVLPR
jgi:hypothetical protein